jgi:hypothetical protein
MPSLPLVCLFTSFHPDLGGGGSACLQSVILRFTRVEVRWLFLGVSDAVFPNTRRIGAPLFGGGFLTDMLTAPWLWSGWQSRKLRCMVDAIAEEEADALWLVAMNEGILVGNALMDRCRVPLHVSVQDDQAEAICRRSRRYRWLESVALGAWQRLLRRTGSVDVISSGMRRYYQEQRHLDSFVFHPHVPALLHPPDALADSELHVGHLGTLYSETEVIAFMQGAGLAAKQLGRRLRLTFIGGNRINPARHANLLPPDALIEVSPSLGEGEALQRLSSCHLLYAMYPFEERCRVFRMTSLPTKLSSYIQIQRPVFAHTPADSTLAEMVQQHRIGGVCDSLDPTVIGGSILRILQHVPERDAFEKMRSAEYGEEHVTRMEDALLALASSRSALAGTRIAA